jgi:hypothetical protein
MDRSAREPADVVMQRCTEEGEMTPFLSQARFAALTAIGLVLVIVGNAAGAAGAAFLLGKVNSAGTAQTMLSTNSGGSAFYVTQTGPGWGLRGSTTNTSALTYGVYGSSASSRGTGVGGISSAKGGSTTGVYGEAASPIGTGVFGTNLAKTGLSTGVYGQVTSPSGTAVYGNAIATTGETKGVFGLATSPDGTGVTGHNNAITGDSIGVYGTAVSTTGTGVYGYDSSATGATKGVYGTVASADGVGVYGYNSSATGSAVGVYGAATSPDGQGVFGTNNALTGDADGVYGASSSTTGVGVFGYVGATTGATSGVFGTTNSPAGAGILGTTQQGVPGLAGAFFGNVRISGTLTVTGAKTGYVADYAVNGSNVVLHRGDAVTVLGVRPAVVGDIPLVVVGPAGAGDPTIGIVDREMIPAAVTKAPRGAGNAGGPNFNQGGTSVSPDHYLLIVTEGAFAVASSDASAGAIRAGDPLTAGSVSGHLVLQHQIAVGGTRFYAPGTSVGYALGALPDGSGQIAVFVSPH